MRENPKPILISFEGIGGCGISTQVKLLSDWFIKNHLKSVVVSDPGGTVFGEKVAELASGDLKAVIKPASELLLLAAARAQLTEEVILPSLKNGIIVVADRYLDSALAYQGFGREMPEREVKKANELATGGLLPDLTFVIDVCPMKAYERKGAELNDEDKEYFERVRFGYRRVALRNKGRVRLIDGTKTIEQVHRIVILELKKKYGEFSGFN